MMPVRLVNEMPQKRFYEPFLGHPLASIIRRISIAWAIRPKAAARSFSEPKSIWATMNHRRNPQFPELVER